MRQGLGQEGEARVRNEVKRYNQLQEAYGRLEMDFERHDSQLEETKVMRQFLEKQNIELRQHL